MGILGLGLMEVDLDVGGADDFNVVVVFGWRLAYSVLILILSLFHNLHNLFLNFLLFFILLHFLSLLILPHNFLPSPLPPQPLL
jgi:hypothetical protein